MQGIMLSLLINFHDFFFRLNSSSRHSRHPENNATKLNAKEAPGRARILLNDNPTLAMRPSV
jgi:hypothetical protein